MIKIISQNLNFKGGSMRELKYNKLLSIVLSMELYSKIKLITDAEKISIGEWFREAAENKLKKNKGENK